MPRHFHVKSQPNMKSSHSYSYLALVVFVCSLCLADGATAARNRPPHRGNNRTKNRTSTTESATAAVIPGECPESDGFFADPDQCDKYRVCEDGVIVEEKLCPDGLVFNDFSPAHEKCDLPFNIDCSKRPKLQDPKPGNHCRRKNGYFQHEEPNICNKFYYCVDGQFNLITCPDGLVYNERTGICTWPDEAKKKGCSSQELFNFSCPKVDPTFAAQHPRYPDPDDCRFYYVCINGETPRKSGCKAGQVFNPKTVSCDKLENVPECGGKETKQSNTKA